MDRTHSTDPDLDKLEVARAILEQGIAMVHLDPRREGVVVPQRFTQQAVLRLNFAYGFHIPGFVLDEEGIGGWLRFGAERSWCFVPWGAVFAITAPEQHHEGRVWWHAAPVEFLIEVLGHAMPQEDTAVCETPPPPGDENHEPSATPGLRVIEGGSPGEPSGPNRPSRTRPRLRVVHTRK